MPVEAVFLSKNSLVLCQDLAVHLSSRDYVLEQSTEVLFLATELWTKKGSRFREKLSQFI